MFVIGSTIIGYCFSCLFSALKFLLKFSAHIKMLLITPFFRNIWDLRIFHFEASFIRKLVMLMIAEYVDSLCLADNRTRIENVLAMRGTSKYTVVIL